MPRLILAILLVTSLTIPATANLPRHPESVRPLWNESWVVCTTWSVDKLKGLWMTANHCVAEFTIEDPEATPTIEVVKAVRFIGKKPAIIVKTDAMNDLALLQADVHEDAIKLGKYPEVGDIVTVFGYPFGLATPFPTWMHVAVLFTPSPYPEYWKTNMVFDGHAHQGHSGSPILDKKGKAISLLQGGYYGGRGDEAVSLGVTWGELVRFLAGIEEP